MTVHVHFGCFFHLKHRVFINNLIWLLLILKINFTISFLSSIYDILLIIEIVRQFVCAVSPVIFSLNVLCLNSLYYPFSLIKGYDL